MIVARLYPWEWGPFGGGYFLCALVVLVAIALTIGFVGERKLEREEAHRGRE